MSDSFITDAAMEIRRAHKKHGDKSIEAAPYDDLRALAILTEELGEIAREFNDAHDEGRPVDKERLRAELVQLVAVGWSWGEKC